EWSWAPQDALVEVQVQIRDNLRDDQIDQTINHEMETHVRPFIRFIRDVFRRRSRSTIRRHWRDENRGGYLDVDEQHHDLGHRNIDTLRDNQRRINRMVEHEEGYAAARRQRRDYEKDVDDHY